MHNPRCSSAHVHVLCSCAQKVWCFRETFTLCEWHSCWVLEQLVRDFLKASDFLTIHYAMCKYMFLSRKPGIKIYRESNFSQILIFHVLPLLQTVFADHKTTGICTQLWEKTSVPSFYLFVTAPKICSVFSNKAMWQKRLANTGVCQLRCEVLSRQTGWFWRRFRRAVYEVFLLFSSMLSVLTTGNGTMVMTCDTWINAFFLPNTRKYFLFLK